MRQFAGTLWIQSSACQRIWTLSEGAGGGKNTACRKLHWSI